MGPGPGQYETVVNGVEGDSKYVVKRIRGKSVKVRKAPDNANGVFKSTTGRLIEDDLNKVVKT